jgi:transposase
VAPYLALMTDEAPQRRHELREIFNGLRYIGRVPVHVPHALSPWEAVYQQTRRWLSAGCTRRSCTICAKRKAGRLRRARLKHGGSGLLRAWGLAANRKAVLKP